MQIVDPKLASYGVEKPLYAVIQLAQTTMRSELGKITLDKSFEERDSLNDKIVVSISLSMLIVITFLFTLVTYISSIITYENLFSCIDFMNIVKQYIKLHNYLKVLWEIESKSKIVLTWNFCVCFWKNNCQRYCKTGVKQEYYVMFVKCLWNSRIDS